MPNIELVKAIEQQPLTALVNYYVSCLDNHPKAIAFIEKKLGLSIEQAKQQMIGFSNRSLGKQTSIDRRSKRGRALRNRLKTLGVFGPTGHEALRGCITIPVVDESGKVIGIQAKRIDKNGKGPKEILVGKCGVGFQPAMETEPTALAEGVSPEELATNKTAIDTNEQPSENALEVNDDQVIYQVDDRRYRIRGLQKNNAVGSLKVNILASRDDLVHLDAIDLVKARSRASFIKATAAELFVDADLVKRDIGKLLLQLEVLQEQTHQRSEEADVQSLLKIPPQEKRASLGPATRSQPDATHRRRHDRLRHGRRRHEQARWILGSDQSQTQNTAGHRHSKFIIGGKDFFDGRNLGHDAR